MTTPWQQVLELVPSLNAADRPFSYSVEGEQIIGFWDVAKIEMLNLGGASTFDKEYRIEVRPVGDGQIDWTEIGTEASSSLNTGGGSFQKEFFKGKSTQKSFGIEFGKGTSHGEPTTAASWSFDTGAIKKPLFDLLEQHGWKKKGLLGKLFG